MGKIVYSSWNGNIVNNQGSGDASPAVEDKPFDIENSDVGAFISKDGLIITDNTINVVALVKAYMEEVSRLACGECTVGYKGMEAINSILSKIALGQSNESDVDLIREIAKNMQKNVKCDYCSSAVTPLRDALRGFRDSFIAAAVSAEALPKVEYTKEVMAPCQEACPIHQDVPGYIELIRNRRLGKALELIKSTNCMPCVTGRTCVAFCEKNCVRRDIDSAVSIRALKRVPADFQSPKPSTEQAKQSKGSKKDKVAIVGAGPAGLAAAQLLAQYDYQVHVYDDQPSAGGMTFVGIPSYRLPRQVLEDEIKEITSLGVQINLNSPIKDIEELRSNYKAVIVATGAHKSRDNGIENWNPSYTGLIEGVKFLRDKSLGKTTPPKNRVLVIGGGNTAIDCARTALRTGFNESTIVYRRSKNEMPANADEIRAAEEEGVKFYFLAAPTKVHSQADNVVGLECIRMELGEPDESGRRKPVPVAKSEFVLPADLVLTAIGEEADLSLLPQDKIELTKWKTIKTDECGHTSIPWLFAAGDCTSGPASVVEALASGRHTAECVHRFLSKDKDKEADCCCSDNSNSYLREIGRSSKHRGPKPYSIKRLHPEEISAEERIKNFDEVEKCFDIKTATGEAERCLRCYRVMLVVKRQG